MIVKEAPKIIGMLTALIVGKASIITALSLAFGMSFANSQLSGLLLAQGGETTYCNYETVHILSSISFLIMTFFDLN